MNIITFNAAYCLFPRATLEEHQSLLSCSSKGIYRKRGQALVKYMHRGFDIAFRVPAERVNCRRPSFPLGWRWLDDENTWVLPLDIVDVISPPATAPDSRPLRHDPSVVCNWRMQYGTNRGAVMHFSVMKSDLLRYRYLIVDQDLSAHLSRSMTVLYKEAQPRQADASGSDAVL